MNRRNFIQKSVIGTMVAPMVTLPDSIPVSNHSTTYIANYDTESKNCIDNLETIVNMHIRHQMPATFFIVSDILNDTNKQQVVRLLDNPLFEIGSHSKGHNLILPHPLNPRTGNPRTELIDSKKALEDIFGKSVVGYATPYAYVDGFKGHKDILSIVQEAGYKYISTICWGPDYSLPAPILDPFNYQEDGFQDLWEIPKHGWHENILKGHTDITKIRILQWPSLYPEAAIPRDFVKTAEQEFNVNKCFIDMAGKAKNKHLTLAWHPWSLARMDKEMKMLDLTFAYVKKQGFKTGTFHDVYKSLQA